MTSIDFGNVVRFMEDRGFGFVSRTFTGTYGESSEVFFHIKTIKRTNPILAQKINSQPIFHAHYFWYQFEKTPKGAQVTSVIDPSTISQAHPDEHKKFSEAIAKTWKEHSKALNLAGRFNSIPEPFQRAAIEIIPAETLAQLDQERLNLEEEKRVVAELERREAQIRQEERQRQRLAQRQIEEAEFSELVKEISSLRFTHSRQVSDHIVRHKLGNKYKNISGVLQMQMRGTEWVFNGGFPPNIYARLCDELGLENQGSDAKPGIFRSYKDILGG